MNTALCLSGQLRTFQSCYPSLRKYILDDFNPDVFVHTWRQQGDVSLDRDNQKQRNMCKTDEIIDVEQLKRFLDPKTIMIDNFKDSMFDSLDGVSKPKKLWGVYHENKGMLPMFYSIYQCNKLKKQYEREQDMVYDVTIRCRPDLEYLNHIPKNITSCLGDETVFIPSWNQKSKDSFNDSFAIGSSRLIDIYSNCWNFLQEMWDDYSYSRMCETERVLYSFLTSQKIDVDTFLPFYLIRRYNHSDEYISHKKFFNNVTPYFMRSFYHNVKPRGNSQSFSMVEVETHTVCNRSCPYCPVNFYRRENHSMDEKLFRKIVDDLSDIQYRGLFSLMRYNEPLLEERIISFVSYIKDRLPNCNVKLFTNGDYLNYIAFDKLRKVGVDSFEVTNHWVKDKLPENKHLLDFKKDLCVKDRFYVKFKEYKTGSVMNNRGGLINGLDDMVFNGCGPYENYPLNPQLEIDSYGNVLLCCRQYSSDYGPVFGNVKESHVMDIWMNPFFVKTRNELMNSVYSLPICKSCRHGIWNPKEGVVC